MATVGVHLPVFAGVSGTYALLLYPQSSGALANGAGGDALTEVDDGYFTATVAESLSDVHRADITFDGSVIYTGFVDMSRAAPTVDAPWGSTNPVSASLADGHLTAAKFAADFFTALAAAVWNALTSGLSTVGSIGKWILDKLDVVVSTRAAPGAQMDLVDSPNATARAAFATSVEAAIFNEADATALLAAISAKVEEFLINEGDATATLAAIAAAVRTNLATELGRIDASVSSRLATAGYTAPLTAQATRDAMKLAPAAGAADAGSIDQKLDDVPTAAEIDTELSTTHGDGSWEGGGGGGAVIIAPIVGVAVGEETEETEIRCKVASLVPKTVTVVDANGDAVDLRDFDTLRLVIESSRKKDVQVVEDADLTIGGADFNQFTFTPAAATVAAARTLKWSLRDIADDLNRVIVEGNLIVEYSALKDPAP